ncbi:hypothetical protein R1sor_003820 [Riccia sorocarpa]|uniref:F-box/LRR-repeat protein 15-like leucin rich repeat domain-containing protein n=1 Tax=Riccia sorocarpa TaxID=122646 RepID=A0ABD3H315_9MARC
MEQIRASSDSGGEETFAMQEDRKSSASGPERKKLELNGLPDGGEQLKKALSESECDNLVEINLEFAQGIEDEHVELIAQKVHTLEKINLNACQKVTDESIHQLTAANPNLRSFSIYWNLRITDEAVEYLLQTCTRLTELNLSGCKGITDKSLQALAKHCRGIQSLNLTRCIKLTDKGLISLLESCTSLQELYLYAVSSFTDDAFKKFSNVHELRLLDVCGAQYLSDEGVAAIAECAKLVSLNLTWCVRVTDVGLKALARNCKSLEILSLHGLLGVTDEGIEELAKSCSRTLHTLDVNGCVNIKRRSKDELLQLFPNLTTFLYHS